MTQKDKIKELECKVERLELEIQLLSQFMRLQQNPIIIYPREVYPTQPQPYIYPWTYPTITYLWEATC